jgi:hypothetical protein
MEQTLTASAADYEVNSYEEAWEMASGQLRMEMSRALYETWVAPLRPLGFEDGVFTVGAYNPYAREWVENRLKGRLTRLLEGFVRQPVALEFVVAGEGVRRVLPMQAITPALHSMAVVEEPPVLPAAQTGAGESRSPRKVMLQRAYGDRRAAVIQPERGMFMTLYFLYQWLPLIGQSAMTVILAARSMCYWNPMTGELRNVVETEMKEIAQRAAVSVRTVKAVLNDDLVKTYFLRYRVRRVMTTNGVRTAGIVLQVRMDDPLTPEDQLTHDLTENEDWYLPEFAGEDEDL